MSDKIRAIVGGKVVVGWYFSAEDIKNAIQKHYLIFANAEIWHYIASPDDTEDERCALNEEFFVEIDPALAAVDTGKDDKNGKRIFGSKGIFQGGDRVAICSNGQPAVVYWNEHQSAWYARLAGASLRPLCSWKGAEIEIIPKEDV